MFIYPLYNHNWRNISTIYIYIYIYKTRLASKEIFSPSNKIHREVGRAKDLSAPRYLKLQIRTNLSLFTRWSYMMELKYKCAHSALFGLTLMSLYPRGENPEDYTLKEGCVGPTAGLDTSKRRMSHSSSVIQLGTWPHTGQAKRIIKHNARSFTSAIEKPVFSNVMDTDKLGNVHTA